MFSNNILESTPVKTKERKNVPSEKHILPDVTESILYKCFLLMFG